MSRADLLAFFDRKLAPGAPEGRRLATHVFAKSAAPAALVADAIADEYYPPPPDRSSDLQILQA